MYQKGREHTARKSPKPQISIPKVHPSHCKVIIAQPSMWTLKRNQKSTVTCPSMSFAAEKYHTPFSLRFLDHIAADLE